MRPGVSPSFPMVGLPALHSAGDMRMSHHYPLSMQQHRGTMSGLSHAGGGGGGEGTSTHSGPPDVAEGKNHFPGLQFS